MKENEGGKRGGEGGWAGACILRVKDRTVVGLESS